MIPIETVWVWIAALLTIFTFSFLIKDNPFYKIAEHTAIGASAGHWVVMSIKSINDNAIYPMTTRAEFWYIIPVILGLCMFAPLFPAQLQKYRWISRYAIACLIGVGAAVSMTRSIQSEFVGQILITLPKVTKEPLVAFSQVIVIIGVISAIPYFLFFRKQKGSFGYLTRLGRLFMMVTFGAGFVSVFLAYLSTMMPRILFLLRNWLHIV